MNINWKIFLQNHYSASITDNEVIFPETTDSNDKAIFALNHLAVLAVCGTQAGTFLQGQITCNINEINEKNCCLGAFCNVQGKVISTCLVVKSVDGYLLLLPSELLETIKNRLQKYILRADVQLINQFENWCLIGLLEAHSEPQKLGATTQTNHITIHFDHRRLSLVKVENVETIWSDHVSNGFTPKNSTHWRYLDIMNGIPWLTLATSEQFIPQMLNLDKLGAISFNKGCYTGQEIVARTHYLGKAKRALFSMSGKLDNAPPANTVIADVSGQSIGKIINAIVYQGIIYLLAVLPVDNYIDSFNLPDYPNHLITLINNHG